MALVEFSICLPVLAILTFGIIDVGRLFVAYEGLQNAAREAATYASQHPGQQHASTGTACADPANADWRGAHEGSATRSYTFTYSTDMASCVTDPTQLPSTLAPGKPLRVKARTVVHTLTPLLPATLSVGASVCVSVAGATPSGAACP